MASNNLQRKDYCPSCRACAIFDEIHTSLTLAKGQSKVRVAVFRCPECKRLVGPTIPPINRVNEP